MKKQKQEMEKIADNIIKHSKAIIKIGLKGIPYERRAHWLNWMEHAKIHPTPELKISPSTKTLFCPYCGTPASEGLIWKCKPDKSIEDAYKQTERNIDDSQERKTTDPRFFKEDMLKEGIKQLYKEHGEEFVNQVIKELAEEDETL